MPIAMMGAVVGGLLILLWWLFFSRAPWSERLGVTVLMIVALFATSRLVHESIAGGAMGFCSTSGRSPPWASRWWLRS